MKRPAPEHVTAMWDHLIAHFGNKKLALMILNELDDTAIYDFSVSMVQSLAEDSSNDRNSFLRNDVLKSAPMRDWLQRNHEAVLEYVADFPELKDQVKLWNEQGIGRQSLVAQAWRGIKGFFPGEIPKSEIQTQQTSLSK